MYCVLPSYTTCQPVLTKFSVPNDGYKGDLDDRLLEIDDQLWRLNLPTGIPSANIKDIYSAKITLDTHPGLVTRSLAERSISANFKKQLKRITKEHLLHYTTRDLINN